MEPQTLPSAPSEPPAPSITTPPPKPTTPKANAVEIVWQWLCYGLWIWALISLCTLLATTLNYYFRDEAVDYNFTIYVLAALLCLLVPAFIADRLYAKREPEHKHGFGAVVMVLNAVVVFLATLSAFITAAVTSLSLAVDPGSASTRYVVIVSAFVTGVLGGMLFIRILNPPRLRRLNRLFPFVVVGISLVTILLALFGPFRSEVGRRNDKLIERHLPTINRAIQGYATKNKKLPATLSDISLNDSYEKDARILVDRQLVTYTIVTTDTSAISQPDQSLKQYYNSRSPLGEYELCVVYKQKKGSPGLYSTTELSYLSTYAHEAGKQCYKQVAYSTYY